MPQQIEFNKFNPFRRPDWRINRVLEMLNRPDAGPRGAGRCGKRDDPYVRALRQFVAEYNRSDEAQRNRLAYSNPGLFWAFKIYESREDDNDHKATLIEARILAGQSNDDIAKELFTIPDTVAWYEACFFHARDRLAAHDWILDHVLMPAFQSDMPEVDPEEAENPNRRPVQRPISEPYFDSTTKWFAYFGGPFVLDFVLTGFRRGAVTHSREEVSDWIDSHWKGRLRQRSATSVQNFEVNRYNVMELFTIHKDIIALEKKAEEPAELKDGMTKAVKTMLNGMQWGVGAEGAKMVAGTAIERYDEGAAELRDDELMLAGLGEKPFGLDEVATMTMPPPRKKDEDVD